jgi:predicted site-specific integrase-resolvase
VSDAIYYELKELTRFFPVKERTLVKWAQTGELPGAVKLGGRWFVDREKLEAHLGRKLPDPQRQKGSDT